MQYIKITTIVMFIIIIELMLFGCNLEKNTNKNTLITGYNELNKAPSKIDIINLSGIVYDENTNPVIGAEIILNNEFSVFSDLQGEFKFSNISTLFDQTKNIQIVASGYEKYENDIVLPENTGINIKIFLKRKTSDISGFVINNEKTVKNACVKIDDREFYTDKNGKFQFSDLKNNIYEINTFINGFLRKSEKIYLNSSINSFYIDLNNSRNITQFKDIKGKIVDSNSGTGIANIIIRSDKRESVYSDSNGDFVLKDLKLNEYYELIFISTDGKYFNHYRKIFIDQNTDLLNITLSSISSSL